MTVNHIRLMVGGHLQMSLFSDFHAYSRPDIPEIIGTCSPKYLSGHICYDRYDVDLCQCPMTGNHHFYDNNPEERSKALTGVNAL